MQTLDIQEYECAIPFFLPRTGRASLPPISAPTVSDPYRILSRPIASSKVVRKTFANPAHNHDNHDSCSLMRALNAHCCLRRDHENSRCPQEDIQAGLPWAILEAQGSHNTIYVSSFTAFESVVSIFAYGNMLENTTQVIVTPAVHAW